MAQVIRAIEKVIGSVTHFVIAKISLLSLLVAVDYQRYAAAWLGAKHVVNDSTPSARGVLSGRIPPLADDRGVTAVAEVAGRRMTAEIDGDFVVFLIGARFDRLHLARTLMDLGGRRGMKHMLDYLVAHPEKGLLAYEMGIPTIVQYWRSFEHLEAFAKDADDPHLDVWRQYWRRVGRTARTGIWHETYLVKAGQYEAVYGNMPPRGLGRAGRLVPMAESSSARARLRGLSA